MPTTLVLRLEHSKMSRLRDLVNDKGDDLFSKLSRAESVKNVARVEGLTESLKFWNEIDRALRDAQPEPVASEPSPLCKEANELLRIGKLLLERYEFRHQWTPADEREVFILLNGAIARAEGRA